MTHHFTRTRRRRRVLAVLVAGTAAAGAGGLPGASAAISPSLTVPLPAAGQYQLCYRSGPTHVGKCNASPLIHKGEMTVRGTNLGAAPVVSVAEDCSTAGPEVTISAAPGASVSASVTGVKLLTGERGEVQIAEIPLDHPVSIYACLSQDEAA